MRKTFVVAWREYMAAVKTKGFIVGIILIPLIMAVGIFLQSLADDVVDLTPRTCAVIDRTPDGRIFSALDKAADERNDKSLFDKKDPKKQIKPRYEFKRIIPTSQPTGREADDLRFDLSEKIRRGELFAYIEIGADILNPKMDVIGAMKQMAGDTGPDIEQMVEPGSLVYYSSNRSTYTDLQQFIQVTIAEPVYMQRLEKIGANITLLRQLIPPAVLVRGLASRDVASGKVAYESKQGQVASVLVPAVLLAMLLIVVMVGASPLTTNIVEEKQLRIAEVLLSSLSPFELMLGKLLGGVATSLTLGAIYLGAGAFAAHHMGVLAYLTVPLVIWFVGFLIIASLMYGALFIAAGAAATNIKEAQALVTPVMMVVIMPLFLVRNLLADPNGTVAQIGTYFPLSAPLITMMRIATPPGISWWESGLSALSAMAMTILLIWVAGRIFKIGFLMTGRGATLRELANWVFRI